MKKYSKEYSVSHLCDLVKISRSGYYEWLNRKESNRAKENRFLLVSIRSSYHGSRQTYGAIRIHQELQEKGIACGKNRVARIMNKEGIKSIHRKKYRPQTTQSNHNLQVADNVIHQDFTAKQVNEKWGCDISYIRTNEGWLYLAIVLDFYSRKVVGFSTGKSLQTDLCIQALKKACIFRNPPKNLIHHSDRGVQYASHEYSDLLKNYHFTQSMSRKGNCYDNAMVESFFHTLKVELVHRNQYLTREEAKTDIEDYILNFYNPVRRHSSLDYLSPNQYEYFNNIAL